MQDDVLDIQIVNNEMVKIKRVTFELKAIESKVAKMKYRGQGLIKDYKVENAKLPSIAKVFYECIYDRIIPSAETLYSKYLKKHYAPLENGMYRLDSTGEEYKGEGLKARVFRAFPSLLRDFHFYLLCYNANLFDEVSYSFITDTQEGIDILITHKGVVFAISLFVNTKRSMGFKKRKYRRHDYSNLKEICISIDPFDRNNYVGDYALYNQFHIDYMVNEMEEMLKSVVGGQL